MNTIVLTIILGAVITGFMGPALADNHTNHYKQCVKMKDKQVRSILCPDMYDKNETTIKLYG